MSKDIQEFESIVGRHALGSYDDIFQVLTGRNTSTEEAIDSVHCLGHFLHHIRRHGILNYEEAICLERIPFVFRQTIVQVRAIHSFPIR